MSVTGLANACSPPLDRAYLSNIELGHRKSVSPGVRQRIANALDVPVAVVMGLIDQSVAS